MTKVFMKNERIEMSRKYERSKGGGGGDNSGWFGCFSRRRRKRRARKHALAEMREELDSLNDTREQQEDEIFRLKEILDQMKIAENKIKEENLNLREDLGEAEVLNKSHAMTMDMFEKEREKLEDEVISLRESLKSTNIEGIRIREDREVFRRQLTDLQTQMSSTQENLNDVTVSLQTAREKIGNLESLKGENEETIKQLQKTKAYLLKKCQEKDIEFDALKMLYDRDREAFYKVRDFQLQNTDRLKQKYHNALTYLWDMSYKCSCDCRSSWAKPGKSLKAITNQQTLQIDDSLLKGRFSLLAEPNATILNSTFAAYDNELFRYKQMNEMLEDKIKEYESENGSRSSSYTSTFTDASNLSLSSSQVASSSEDLAKVNVGASKMYDFDLILEDDIYCYNNNHERRKQKP